MSGLKDSTVRATRVTVISNVAHSRHIAFALADDGLLWKYKGPLLFTSQLASCFPARVQNLVARRMAPRLKGLPYRPLLLSELLFHILHRLSLRPSLEVTLLSFARSLASFRSILRADTVHFHSGTCFSLTAVAKLMGKTLVCDFRAAYPGSESRQPRLKSFEREFARSDHIIVVSDLVRNQFEQAGIPFSKISVIPLGVDLERFPWTERASLLAGGELQVLSVGRINSRKGIDTLLESVSDMTKVQVRLVGSVDTQFAATLDTSNAVLVGVLGGDDLVAEYARTDLLAMPSRSDSFGLVALEAMATGCPVIVSDMCGVASIVDTYDAGCVVAAADAAALRRAFERFRSHPHHLVKAGLQARKAAEAYSWSAYELRLHEFYRMSSMPTLSSRRGPVLSDGR